MAKNDLLGGTLWESYSDKVADRMNNPQHLGEITDEEARELGCRLIVADWGAKSCGDAIRLFWAVDANDVIVRARYQTFGCGTAIASSDIMVELCVGKTVRQAMEISNIDVERALRDAPDRPAVPPQKMHCSVMAYDVIKEAAALYLNVDRSTLEDSEMVCECAQITLSTLRDVIRTNDLKTVEEITQYTKAGGFCKSCIRPGGHEERKYYLEDILREERARMDFQKEEKKPFSARSLFRKGKIIEDFFEAEVREMLRRDGGDIEIRDLREDGAETVVEVGFKGACAGCAGAGGATRDAIERMLRESVDGSIVVRTQT